ncbi:MAG: hypothetical protein ACI9VR_002791 [Cognaticolwellia sp.]|jgi:hypothetical protein
MLFRTGAYAQWSGTEQRLAVSPEGGLRSPPCMPGYAGQHPPARGKRQFSPTPMGIPLPVGLLCKPVLTLRSLTLRAAFRSRQHSP